MICPSDLEKGVIECMISVQIEDTGRKGLPKGGPFHVRTMENVRMCKKDI